MLLEGKSVPVSLALRLVGDSDALMSIICFGASLADRAFGRSPDGAVLRCDSELG